MNAPRSVCRRCGSPVKWDGPNGWVHTSGLASMYCGQPAEVTAHPDDRTERALAELRQIVQSSEHGIVIGDYALSRVHRAITILEGRPVPYHETVYR